VPISATDYLLKVFDYKAQSGTFEEAPLENQIDRERIFADEALKRDFKAWLLDSGILASWIVAPILIPEKFLARGAIAATPVGFAASEPAAGLGLLQADDAKADAVFRESDVVAP